MECSIFLFLFDERGGKLFWRITPEREKAIPSLRSIPESGHPVPPVRLRKTT
jgi:hypothetical protein